jgi:quercetin dioxygenase-like cupin family protein
MHRRASTAPVTIAIWILLFVALDAGPGTGQAEPDRGPGGRRWMPMPFFPAGADVIFLVGDPLRGAGYMYVRFPAAYAPPLHAHTATERIYVSRGNLLLERPNSETIQKPMGAYFVVKAGAVHTTVCAGPEDCFCYISIDRAFDVIPFRHDNRF